MKSANKYKLGILIGTLTFFAKTLIFNVVQAFFMNDIFSSTFGNSFWYDYGMPTALTLLPALCTIFIVRLIRKHYYVEDKWGTITWTLFSYIFFEVITYSIGLYLYLTSDRVDLSSNNIFFNPLFLLIGYLLPIFAVFILSYVFLKKSTIPIVTTDQNTNLPPDNVIQKSFARTLLSPLKPSIFKILNTILLAGLGFFTFFNCFDLFSSSCSRSIFPPLSNMILVVLIGPALSLADSFPIIGIAMIPFEIIYLYILSILLSLIPGKIAKWMGTIILLGLIIFSGFPLWQDYQAQKKADVERKQGFIEKFNRDTGFSPEQVFVLEDTGMKLDSMYSYKEDLGAKYEINYTNGDHTSLVSLSIYTEPNSDIAKSKATELLNLPNHESYKIIEKYGNNIYDVQEVGGGLGSVRYLWTTKNNVVLFSATTRKTNYEKILNAYLTKYPSLVTTEAVNWKIYEDNKYGFALKYPNDWKMSKPIVDYATGSSIPITYFESPDGKYKFSIESDYYRQDVLAYKKIDAGIVSGDVQFFKLYGYLKNIGDTELDPNNPNRYGLYEIGTYKLKTGDGLNYLLDFKISFDKKDEAGAIDIFTKILSTIYFPVKN